MPPVVKPPAPPPPTEPIIRVRLEDNLNQARLTFLTPFALKLEEATYIFDSNIGELLLSFDGSHFTIKNDKRYIQLPMPLQIVFRPLEGNGNFEWNEKQMAGTLAFVSAENQLQVITSLPMETYLAGVLPYEMPSGDAGYLEALKAQAVAARSYALYQKNQRANAIFDVYADVRDQVFGGFQKNSPLVQDALEATRGLVLMQNGSVALTQYHSTCGGILVRNPDTLLTASSPVRDAWQDLPNCRISPLFRWVEYRTPEQIIKNSAVLFAISADSLKTWLEYGTNLSLFPENNPFTGRVESLTVQIGKHRYTANGYQIRQLLADSSGAALPSNLFFLLKPDERSNRLVIIGAGFGHGNGMCQWGALGLSLRGGAFAGILKFYYPDAELKKLY